MADIHPHLSDTNDIFTMRRVHDKPEPTPFPEWVKQVTEGKPDVPFDASWLLNELRKCPEFNNHRLIQLLELAQVEGGLRLDHDIEHRSVDACNTASAYIHADVTHAEVKRFVEKGFLLGPFSRKDLPFQYLRISPMFVIEKKTRGKWRMIVNLSAPDGDSVNDSRELQFTIKYESIKVAIQRLRELRRANEKRLILLSKEDIETYYHRLPVRPKDWWQMGIRWFDVNHPLPPKPRNHADEEKIYIFRVLPMGAIASVELAHAISRAINFLFLHSDVLRDHSIPAKAFSSVIYIDDFMLMVTKRYTDAARVRLRLLLQCCGLPISPDPRKQIDATFTVDKEYLGIVIHAMNMTVSITADRRASLLQDIKRLLKRHFYLRKHYRSILGAISFVASCIPNGRTYMRRLWNALRYASNKRNVQITKTVKQDLYWWNTTLRSWSGTSVIREPTRPPTPSEMIISGDARGSKHGNPGRWCVVNLDAGQYAHGDFPADDLHINVLELLTSYGAALLWPNHKYLHIFTDNTSAEASLSRNLTYDQSRTSPSPAFMTVLRELSSHEAIHDTIVVPERVSSKDNILADAGSRNEWQRFNQHCTNINISLQEVSMPAKFYTLCRRAAKAQQLHQQRMERRH